MIRNTSLSSNKSQAGFSLVELMVVVAIIGALAMVAVPRVNRFIAKARTSEAQVNLSSIYTFNKNFFVEFQGYTNSLGAMGYNPEGQLRYNLGWSNAVAAPTQFTTLRPGGLAGGTDGINAISSTLAVCTAAGAPTLGCRTLTGSNNALPPAVVGDALAADFSTFTAGARAVIVAASACANNADDWRINHNKILVNQCDGTQ